MKFYYKKYGQEVFRPVIPIEVGCKGNLVSYEVLVDSGADSCFFDAEIADILDIDLNQGEVGEVAGITGVKEKVYFYPVDIKVGGWPFKIKAGFLKNISEFGYGVVGQKGFFNLFIVKFDLNKKEINLTPRVR